MIGQTKIQDMAIVQRNGFQVMYFKIGKNVDLSTFKSLSDKSIDDLTLILSDAKEKSLDANSYCWILIKKIAKAIPQDWKDLYRDFIKQFGESYHLYLDNDAVEVFENTWEAHGDGWIVDIVSSDDTHTQVVAYRGISDYNNLEMHNFLENVKMVALEYDIDTRTPQEIERINKLWKAT